MGHCYKGLSSRILIEVNDDDYEDDGDDDIMEGHMFSVVSTRQGDDRSVSPERQVKR